MVWLGTFIAFVYSVLIIFSVSLTFSLDATHKLQRQVDGWMATNTESGSNEQRKYCRKNPEEEAMVIKGIK